MPSEHIIDTDILVVGGGIAGCLAAIKAREHGLKVTIADKAYAGKSGASISPPAGMFVYNPDWGIGRDVIMKAFDMDGEYINHREWCEIIIDESLAVHEDLDAWGVNFGPYTPETAKMICPPYTNTPIPFRGISPVLRKQAKKAGAEILDRIMGIELIKQNEKIVGMIGFSTDTGDIYIFNAKATVMTAGGNSFKPAGFPISMLTGDAEAMAYRAGAGITGKEFCCTTHPTRADHPAALFAMKHMGPVPFFNLFDANDEEQKWSNAPVHTEPDLSIDFLAHAGKTPLYADLGRMPDMQKQILSARFPMAAPVFGKVPLAGGSAVGYGSVGTGGIWVRDTRCATDLPGLFAAGDCGGTRHNGALIVNVGGGTGPTAVIGRRAGSGAAEYAAQASKPEVSAQAVAEIKKALYAPMERKSGYAPRWVTQLLQNTMTPYFVSYIKHGSRLQAALTTVEFLRDHLVSRMYARDLHELRLVHETGNMVLTAEMILRASLFRTESRGSHYREDCPGRDDPKWLAWTQVKEENGMMKAFKVAVPKNWQPDLSISYQERYPKRFPGEGVE